MSARIFQIFWYIDPCSWHVTHCKHLPLQLQQLQLHNWQWHITTSIIFSSYWWWLIVMQILQQPSALQVTIASHNCTMMTAGNDNPANSSPCLPMGIMMMILLCSLCHHHHNCNSSNTGKTCIRLHSHSPIHSWQWCNWNPQSNWNIDNNQNIGGNWNTGRNQNTGRSRNTGRDRGCKRDRASRRGCNSGWGSMKSINGVLAVGLVGRPATTLGTGIGSRMGLGTRWPPWPVELSPALTVLAMGVSGESVSIWSCSRFMLADVVAETACFYFLVDVFESRLWSLVWKSCFVFKST